MPSLSELQRRFAAALIAPPAEGVVPASPTAAAPASPTVAASSLPPEWFRGPVPPAESLRVHRNTTLGACANALRLSYPSVERALGVDYFDRLAADCARAGMPERPQLDAWGEQFIARLAVTPALQSMPWVIDLARFDWALERLGQVAATPQHWSKTIRWTTASGLQLAASLRLVAANCAIDEVRDAVMQEELATLRTLLAEPAPHHFALWRAERGVMVRRISDACARWLEAALAACRGDAAAREPIVDDAASTPREPIALVLPAPDAEVLRELRGAGFARLDDSGD